MARTYGDEITTCGGALADRSQAPNAPACSAPSGDSGTSMSRSAMSSTSSFDDASTVTRHVAEALSMAQQPEFDRIADHGHVRTRRTL